jgi:hypothetical protein
MAIVLWEGNIDQPDSQIRVTEYSQEIDSYPRFPYTSSSTHTLEIYGMNYNVLRIMSGLGGLAYSN